MQLIVTWVTDLFGGEIIPLVIFPAFLQKIAFALPFAAMFSTPLLIYVGVIAARALRRGDRAAGVLARRARRRSRR